MSQTDILEAKADHKNQQMQLYSKYPESKLLCKKKKKKKQTIFPEEFSPPELIPHAHHKKPATPHHPPTQTWQEDLE